MSGIRAIFRPDGTPVAREDHWPIGESWLSCALGHKACREDLSVLYYSAPRLFAALALARRETGAMASFCADSPGSTCSCSTIGTGAAAPEQARDLLEIVEDRNEAGSLLITSQLPLDRWHDIIAIPTLADAVLDRVVHNAYRIELSSESRRKRQAPEPAT